MTYEEKAKVESLRKAGLGYKKIAEMTGLSSETVKAHCRRNGLTMLSDDPNRCKCCGKPLELIPGRKPKKFCSDRCRNKWWNSHLELVKRKSYYEFICPHCGKTFTVYGNSGRKYCCHECYIEDRFGGAQRG